ncbi:hypothetical protein VNO77_19892 [Canavalia gladiata]|uniref:Uncharacterized protein n=1 Tax=Canavalia gladiata TaxID=3824 RepID=A0AAN9LP66_CANGL
MESLAGGEPKKLSEKDRTHWSRQRHAHGTRSSVTHNNRTLFTMHVAHAWRILAASSVWRFNLGLEGDT